MTLSEDMELLGQVSFFDGFPAEQIRMLSFGSRRMFLHGGETLFSQGAVSDGGYVVVSGQIDLFLNTDGREFLLASQLAGSLIGEASLITQNRRNTGAIARGNSQLLFLPRELFLRMLRGYPQLAALIHQRIAAAVREMIGKMTEIERKMQSIPELTAPQEIDFVSTRD